MFKLGVKGTHTLYQKLKLHTTPLNLQLSTLSTREVTNSGKNILIRGFWRAHGDPRAPTQFSWEGPRGPTDKLISVQEKSTCTEFK